MEKEGEKEAKGRREAKKKVAKLLGSLSTGAREG